MNAIAPILIFSRRFILLIFNGKVVPIQTQSIASFFLNERNIPIHVMPTNNNVALFMAIRYCIWPSKIYASPRIISKKGKRYAYLCRCLAMISYFLYESTNPLRSNNLITPKSKNRMPIKSFIAIIPSRRPNMN
jgi:Na+/proline symporter